MGVKEIKDTFHAAAPGWSLTAFTLAMGRADGSESQILTFRGRKPDGSTFEHVKTVHGSADVLKAARDVAAELIGA